MQPINIVKVYTFIILAIACYLLIGGCKATFFPKLQLVTADQEPAEINGYPVVHFEISQKSRLMGVLRFVTGLALGCYAVRTFLPSRRGKAKFNSQQ